MSKFFTWKNCVGMTLLLGWWVLVVIGVFSVILAAFGDDEEAMRKCQEQHSYSVCVHSLRR